jgi:hypothetical protein
VSLAVITALWVSQTPILFLTRSHCDGVAGGAAGEEMEPSVAVAAFPLDGVCSISVLLGRVFLALSCTMRIVRLANLARSTSTCSITRALPSSDCTSSSTREDSRLTNPHLRFLLDVVLGQLLNLRILALEASLEASHLPPIAFTPALSDRLVASWVQVRGGQTIARTSNKRRFISSSTVSWLAFSAARSCCTPSNFSTSPLSSATFTRHVSRQRTPHNALHQTPPALSEMAGL